MLTVAPAIGIVIATRHRARARRHAVLGLVSRVAAPMRGRVLETYAESVEWLNANWAAPTRTDELYATRDFAAASGVMRGFRVLVEVEPQGVSGEDYTYEPRINLYVAAQLPNDGGRLAARLASLQRSGFKAQILPARARACERTRHG